MNIDFKGMDLIRGRDCTIFIKGDGLAVAVDATMLAGGWVGGQGVMWAPGNVNQPTVTYSNGLYGGFAMWGSAEQADQYTSLTGQYLKYGLAVIMVGRALISTIAYEQFTYASRTSGPLVPLVYNISDVLYLSRRGLWTKEDELSLSPVSSNAPAFYTGFVAQLPKVSNQMRLGIQTSL